MVAKRAKRPKSPSSPNPTIQARVVRQLGKKQTAREVAKANSLSLEQVRYIAHKAGVSTLRGSQTAAAKPAAKVIGALKTTGKRGRPRKAQLVAANAIRPAISKTCDSCSFLLGILRNLVQQLRPRGLLGAKR